MPPAAELASAPAQPAPPPAPAIDGDPARLFGLDEAGLGALLGAPAFERIDGPARLVRFRDERCLLDLFLYRDHAAPPAYRVRHVEARTSEGERMAPRFCLTALLRERAQR